MPILNCSVTTCYHNKANMCCLDNIKVEGETADVSDSTACGSFKDKESESYSNASYMKNGETAELKTDIDCAAHKCSYNDNSKCYAGHIDVTGSDASDLEETRCATFIKK